MEIQLKLYGSSKMLSDKEILHIELPNNSNIEKLRSVLNQIIAEKYSKKNLLKRNSSFSNINYICFYF